MFKIAIHDKRTGAFERFASWLDRRTGERFVYTWNSAEDARILAEENNRFSPHQVYRVVEAR